MSAAEERVALVTGAARGIGAATARALLAKGYRVALVDVCSGAQLEGFPGVDYPLASADQLDQVAAGHRGVLRYPADVRRPDQVHAAVHACVETFGRLDVVVTAAAVLLGGQPLWEVPAEHLETIWDVDVRGTWNVAAAAVPVMLAGPDPSGCRFVAIASPAGQAGLHRLSAYTVAKHAVIGLIRGLAADLRNTGITAVAVSPGSTRTDMLAATARVYQLAQVEDFAGSHLLGRLLTPEEVAAAVLLCCSREGAVLNGSVVSADGGFVG